MRDGPEGTLAGHLRLARKAALVTGGSRGIGRSVALRLAAESCSVGICARGSEDLNHAVEELRGQDMKACGVVADVEQEGDVERFVAEGAAELDRVDLLVVNAGSAAGGRFLTSTPQDWRETFELNVGHAARAIRACVPHMQQAGGGAVVIIASISGWKPAPRPQYRAAKPPSFTGVDDTPSVISVNTGRGAPDQPECDFSKIVSWLRQVHLFRAR